MTVLSVPDLEKIVVRLREDLGECLLVVESLEFKIGKMKQEEASHTCLITLLEEGREEDRDGK